MSGKKNLDQPKIFWTYKRTRHKIHLSILETKDGAKSLSYDKDCNSNDYPNAIQVYKEVSESKSSKQSKFRPDIVNSAEDRKKPEKCFFYKPKNNTKLQKIS